MHMSERQTQCALEIESGVGARHRLLCCLCVENSLLVLAARVALSECRLFSTTELELSALRMICDARCAALHEQLNVDCLAK